MFTKRIEVLVPEGINQIWVERAWLQELIFEPLAWRTLGGNPEYRLQGPDEPIRVLPGQSVEIISNPRTLPPNHPKSVRKWYIWPAIRRQLTEARDRIAPALRRLSNRKNLN
jgi:hypothetical protein